MRTIDNINERLGDDLKGELVRGSKLRISAATFSIYAFEALKRELEEIDELKFIFTSPTFGAERDTDHLPKERRQFFIPQGRLALRQDISSLSCPSRVRTPCLNATLQP